MNEYDLCVANKVLNGTQMTVMWHVDDLKVSHKDQSAIDDFAVWPKSKYKKKDKGLLLFYHKGKMHDYLGINLDYSERKTLKVSMIKYIDKIFKGFSDDIETPALDPAAKHLFQVREDGRPNTSQKKKLKNFTRSWHSCFFYVIVPDGISRLPWLF